jgi:hypothetical protein
MQSVSGGDHGQDVFLLVDPSLEQDRLAPVILQKLLHLGRQVFERFGTETLDVHRFGELDKVWVGHSGVRVSLVVEEV